VVENAGNPPAMYQWLQALVGRRWQHRSEAAPCHGIDALATLSRSG
jgi:hypothetical protein